MKKVQWLGGSGGMLPQEFFLNLDVLRSILLLFVTLFYHGKASVIAVVKKSTVAKNQQLPCNRIR